MRTALKASCDVYFYEMAKRVGIDRIAAMARRFGLAWTSTSSCRARGGPGADARLAPGAGQALVARRHDRARHRPGLLPAHAAVAGDHDGAARHRARGAAAPDARDRRAPRCAGRRAEDWPSLGIPRRPAPDARRDVGGGERAGGTAGASRLPARFGAQMAGKTGTTQVRRVTREQRERGFNVREPAAARMAAACAVRRLRAARQPALSPSPSSSSTARSGSGRRPPLARDILVEAFQRLRPAAARPARGGGGAMSASSDALLARDRGAGVLEKLWQIPWPSCCCSAPWRRGLCRALLGRRRQSRALCRAARHPLRLRPGADAVIALVDIR
jgi:penicillin-binding protein 2